MWHTFLVRFGGAPMVYSLGVVLVLPWGCPARLAAQGGCLAAQVSFCRVPWRLLGDPVGCLGMLLGGPRSFGCTGWAFRAGKGVLRQLRSPATRALAAQGGRFVRFGGAPMGGQEAEEHHPL